MQVFFNPEPDISAKELAYVYSHIAINSSLSDTAIEIPDNVAWEMPGKVWRHFSEKSVEEEPRIRFDDEHSS